MGKRKAPATEEFVVEEILDKKVDADGKTSYFLKWKGYDS